MRSLGALRHLAAGVVIASAVASAAFAYPICASAEPVYSEDGTATWVVLHPDSVVAIAEAVRSEVQTVTVAEWPEEATSTVVTVAGVTDGAEAELALLGTVVGFGMGLGVMRSLAALWGGHHG